MRNLAVCLALLFAPRLHAEDGAAPADKRAGDAPACVALLQEFLELEPNRGYDLQGRAGAGACALHLRRSQYLHGVSQKMTQEFSLGARAGKSYAALFLSDSDADDEFAVELCEWRGDQLRLAFSQRQRFGWRKLFAYRATLRRSGERLAGARLFEEKDGVGDEVDCALD